MSIGRVPGTTGIQPSIVDAKGDLIVATAADSVSRLAVGTNGQALLADSTTATGLKWGAVGKVLQVVQGTYTGEVTTTSTTLADTGITVSITPSATTSKVLILATVSNVGKTNSDSGAGARFSLLRGTTAIKNAGELISWTATAIYNSVGSVDFNYLDSPSTTSSTTYKIQWATNAGTSVFNRYNTNNTVMSTITAIEIGA